MKLEWDIHEITDFARNLGNINKFNRFLENATKEIATILLKMMKNRTPVDYGQLKASWDRDNSIIKVERLSNGFEVTLINTTYYARWVNDGHKQRPGRFIPGRWEGKHFRYDPTADGGMVLKAPRVKGKFFVEIPILQLENSRQLNSIIYKNLQNWWKEL